MAQKYIKALDYMDVHAQAVLKKHAKVRPRWWGCNMLRPSVMRFSQGQTLYSIMVFWDFKQNAIRFITVKLFKFMGTTFCGLKTTDIFVDTWLSGFSILARIKLPFIFFVGILDLKLPCSQKIHKLIWLG